MEALAHGTSHVLHLLVSGVLGRADDNLGVRNKFVNRIETNVDVALDGTAAAFIVLLLGLEKNLVMAEEEVWQPPELLGVIVVGGGEGWWRGREPQVLPRKARGLSCRRPKR